MKVQARKRTEEGDLKLSKIFEEEVTKFDERNPEKAILPDQAVKAILNDLKTRASARAGHEVTLKNARLVLPVVENMEKRIERIQKRAGVE